MLLQIVRKEILHHLQSLKFSALLITILALFLMNGIRFRGEYAEVLEKYSQVRIKHQEKLEGQAKMFRFIMGFSVDKPPNPLSFCVEGGEQFMPNTLEIGVSGIAKSVYDEQESNSTLPKFDEIDWAFIVKMFVGLFAILLTYDAICGEKEQGTLALVCSNSISRFSVLWGKYLAAMICLLIPLVIGICIGLLLLMGGVNLSGDSFSRMLIFALICIIYASLFLFLGLFISSVTHRSSISLLILLLTWVTISIVVPSLSGIVANGMADVPSPHEFAIRNDNIIYNPPIYEELQERVNTKRLKAIKAVKQETIGLFDERAEALLSSHNEERDAIRKKQDLARNLARISPAASFQYAAECITDSGLKKQRRFEQATNDYYRTIATLIQGKEQHILKYPHLVFWQLSVEIDGELKEFSVSPSPLKVPDGDTSDLPKFSFPKQSLLESISSSFFDIIVLLLWNLLLASLASLAFIRYDVS